MLNENKCPLCGNVMLVIVETQTVKFMGKSVDVPDCKHFRCEHCMEEFEEEKTSHKLDNYMFILAKEVIADLAPTGLKKNTEVELTASADDLIIMGYPTAISI